MNPCPVFTEVDVGDEQLGVAVVQRTKRERGGPLRGIAHVKLDEI